MSDSSVDKPRKQSLISSFKCAGRGIAAAIKTQRNLWIELVIGALAIKASLWLHLEIAELGVIFTLVFIVIAAELINSAIESLADAVTLEHNENIRRAKDTAAGAVLVLAIGSVIIGLIIFIHAAVRMAGLL